MLRELGRPFGLVAFATSGLIAAAGGVALGGGTAAWTVGLLLAAAVPYSGLLLVDPPQRLVLVLLPALLAGIPLLLAPPLLSDDVYRYQWDARVLVSGRSPYAFAPQAPELSELRDADYWKINHREVPTIYPPLLQALFVAGYATGVGLWGIKALALLLHLGSAAWLFSLKDAPGGNSKRAAVLLALNPLALSEAAFSGHFDVVVGSFLLSAALGLQQGRLGRAGIGLAVALGLKLVGLLLLPLLAVRRAGLAVVVLALGLLCLWPLAQAGGGQGGSGLGHYAQRWRGNEGAFVVFESAAQALVAQLWKPQDQPAHVAPHQVELTSLAPLLQRLAGTALDVHAPFTTGRKARQPPQVFDRVHLAGLLARALVLCFLACVCLALLRAELCPLAATRVLLLTTLLLTPQLHPWYLLWLLPLELARDQRVLLVWSVAVLSAYAPLDAWVQARLWHEPVGARLLQLAAVALALLAERVHP